MINNIIPKLDLSFFESKNAIVKRLDVCLYEEGFQILSIIYDTLIGVLEGPLNTPYENGFFLFKMVFDSSFPLGYPSQFIFITQIFHPNISDNGFVSIAILQREWTPAISRFDKIIYSVQSLLDDPNPDIFLNEKAAKLCKENKKKYDKTVREYTSLFANYSKFQEDIKNLDLKIKIIEKGKKFEIENNHPEQNEL